jgi:hypothetical protein
LKSDNIFELEKMIEFKKKELGELFYASISSSKELDALKVMELSIEIKELEQRLQLLEAEKEGGKRLFCKGCGNSLDPQSRFCSNCGMSINEQAESIPPATSISPQATRENIQERQLPPLTVQLPLQEASATVLSPPNRTSAEKKEGTEKPTGESRSSKAARRTGKPPKKRLLKRPLFWVFVVIMLYLAAVFITNVRYMYFFPI